MKLLKKILNRINGLHYKQEYLCLDNESFTHALHAYLVSDKKVIKDITKLHWFIGYNPVIFAFEPGTISGNEQIEIGFTQYTSKMFDLLPRKHLLAKLEMKIIDKFATDDGSIFIYEGIKGKHRFISGFHQFILQLNNRLYNRKPGNVYLENNLYTQVQIAYSLPRAINLISLVDNGKFNLFPTDLHGKVSKNYYIISLRHEGKACQQVEHARRIVISNVQSCAYKQVYSLGKNHMQELKDKEQFNFSNETSEKFNIALPLNYSGYRELELINHFQYGIHKILLFRITNQKEIISGIDTLSHIHSIYGTWRTNHGLSGNYLIR